MRNPSRRAVGLYEGFHQYEPKTITVSRGDMPRAVQYLGPANAVLYRSGKCDPTTGFKPKSPRDYIHEHERGVNVYRVGVSADTKVPQTIAGAGELVLLGKCLGFSYFDEDGEVVEVGARTPYPELYSIPSGRALVVVQGKSKILALIWGGRLGVEPRGIVH